MARATVVALLLATSVATGVSGALTQGVSTATISPTQGTLGTTVTGTGSNWPSGNHIQAIWDGPTGTYVGSPVVVNSSGGFTLTFSVPSNAQPGSHVVSFWDSEGRYFENATATFVVQQAGPTIVSPVNGQTLGCAGAYLFKVNPVAGASGYLYGFFQNGTMVWENLRDEGQLSGTEYGIQPGTRAHADFSDGPVQVWIRAYVNNQWTNATVITINLSGVCVMQGQWPGTSGPVAASQQYGYPYPNAPACTDGGACVADKWLFYQGQCTSWVAYRLNKVDVGLNFTNSYGGQTWGPASNWSNAARALKILNGTPAVHSVAWYAGGHVAYVEQVLSSSQVVISEMNYDLDNGFRVRTISTSAGWPTDFMHLP